MLIGQILLVTFSRNTQNDIKQTNKIILVKLTGVNNE